MPLPHSSLTLPSTSITISKPRVQSKTSLSRMEARHQEGGGGEEDKTAAAGKGLSSSSLLSLLFGAGKRESETEPDTPRLWKTDVKTTDQHYNHVQQRRLPSLIHIPEAADKSSGESWRGSAGIYICSWEGGGGRADHNDGQHPPHNSTQSGGLFRQSPTRFSSKTIHSLQTPANRVVKCCAFFVKCGRFKCLHLNQLEKREFRIAFY